MSNGDDLPNNPEEGLTNGDESTEKSILTSRLDGV